MIIFFSLSSLRLSYNPKSIQGLGEGGIPRGPTLSEAKERGRGKACFIFVNVTVTYTMA